MSEHYTSNTTSVSAWCPTCKRHTMHRVDDRRRGNCLEHAAAGMSKKQIRQQLERARREREEREQPELEGF